MDRFFDKNASNAQVYQETCKSLPINLLRGISCTLITFGSSSTGKTYTVLGTQEDQGICFSLFDDLFDLAQQEKYIGVSLTLSVLEIANENVFDILSATQKKLEVREDFDSLTNMPGQTDVRLTSKREFRSYLK